MKKWTVTLLLFVILFVTACSPDTTIRDTVPSIATPTTARPMTDSPLAEWFIPAYWYSSPRKEPIRKIAIHHMAATMTARECAEFFSTGERYASSNYVIGYDGEIGCCVHEWDRAWSTSSVWCDDQAVTIEVANSEYGGNWKVSDASMASLIDLCVDICRRNDIKECTYVGTSDGVLQKHEWYADTGCPGPYLGSKFLYISTEVNKRLGVEVDQEFEPYYVMVTVDELNVRAEADMNSEITGTIPWHTIVVISKEKNGLGYTPDRGGWIALEYTQWSPSGVP